MNELNDNPSEGSEISLHTKVMLTKQQNSIAIHEATSMAKNILSTLRPQIQNCLLPDCAVNITCLPDWYAPEHIFPDKVQKDVELSPEAFDRTLWKR